MDALTVTPNVLRYVLHQVRNLVQSSQRFDAPRQPTGLAVTDRMLSRDFFLGEGGIQYDYYTRSGVREESEFLNEFFSYKWGTTGANLPGGGTATKPPHAVGFKLKYSQADVYPKVFDFLKRQRRDIRVIHLVRENLLASLCSACAIPLVMQYFKRPNVRRHQSLKGFSPRFRLDTTTLLSRLVELEVLIQQSRNKVRHFECLEITYEALVSREPSVISQVLEFLRVPRETQLCSKYQKILPFDLARILDNMDEVRIVLSGTKYEKLLSESCI